MSISYSANFEDVILQRVFDHIRGGFYIDVGGSMPTDSSNTCALYLYYGWRGVIIDPIIGLVPEFSEQWKLWRPEDTLISAGAARQPGMMQLYLCSNTQLSTGAPHILDHWRDAGHAIDATKYEVVPTVTLNEVLDKCQVPEFNLLCIDVEGMEGEVLAGIDLRRHRPWLMCIECTLPGTQTDNKPWEQSVLDTGYQRVYEDGCNAWFLAIEHIELLPRFRYPPNWTDQIQLIREIRVVQELQALKDKYEPTNG